MMTSFSTSRPVISKSIQTRLYLDFRAINFVFSENFSGLEKVARQV
jgi:hypothetical protein